MTSDLPEQLQTALRDEYVLEREIGRGSAAVVYVAHDQKRDRLVAIKALNPELGQAVGAERFLREIQILGRLIHPHILPLFDSGDAGGSLFYVMPYVETSLRDLLRRAGQLSLEEAVRVGSQIADALDYAHREGAVHRDIKPENILLSREGNVLLADFGIAHSIGDVAGRPLTETGLTLGTPAYMSPEQACGEQLDGRSDIYSLGCVIYEMLAGEPPFTGPTAQAIIAKRFAHPAPSLGVVRASIPPEIDAVVARALARERADRHGSAAQLAGALRRAHSQRASGETPPLVEGARRLGSRHIALAALALAALGFGGLTLRARLERAATLASNTSALDATSSIAVLPFKNMSEDRSNEYFSDGMADELTSALARVPQLNVSARSSAFVFKGKNATARAVGDSLHVATVLEASIFRDGPALRILATLVDTRTGRTIWSETYNREWRDVLALQSEMAQTIAGQLRVKLVRADISVAARQTTNAQAYESYLKGRFFFAQRTGPALDSSVRYFRQALGIDSTYARAYSGLADSYSLMAVLSFAPRETFLSARSAAERAVAFDSLLPEAHTSRAIISTFYDWDWSSAQRELDRALALDSTDASAFFWSITYLAAQGRLDDAVRAAMRARSLEPLSQVYNTRLGTALTWKRSYPEAEAHLRQTIDMYPGWGSTRAQLARVLAMEGRVGEAVAALPPRTVQLSGYEEGVPGFVYARAGERAEALRELRALHMRAHVVSVAIAAVYAGLGDRDAAFAWLEKSYEAREPEILFLKLDPMFDSLRDDPRYASLAARIHKQ